MSASAQELQESRAQLLWQRDEPFQQLVREHHDLDERIHEFSRLSYLTEQQQFEECALARETEARAR